MIKTSRLFLAAASFALASSTAIADDDKILIGGALSMTGIQAPLDTPGYNGAKVAVKYLNDNGGLLGKQIEFINIDGKSDPVTVGNVAVELIDKGAEIIVAPCDFDFGSPASREAQSAGSSASRLAPPTRSIPPGRSATSSSRSPCGIPRWARRPPISP